ncbi:MAG: dTDP-4-dehydrorhamnose 3,5-epimerase [Cyanobacteria bacterium WB6_1B_304]|jgi:dTDP-4-dehydrorhamnose 3,5-epimerase|nr:dTDP-4-dehydrorhamnose 3,5-epimerase [Cyanobacteria bacterium WB6_1B_304]
MNIIPTHIPEVLIIEPQIFGDHRGFFMESYNQRIFQDKANLSFSFVQDNHSSSLQGTLRGLHYQIHQPQGKLVRVIIGEIFDVAVDLRKSSPTFGQWVGEILTAENKRQLWIPPGFAHGFLVLSDRAEVLYKTTDYYAPLHERTLFWSDNKTGIGWPIGKLKVILSDKDSAGKQFDEIEVYP